MALSLVLRNTLIKGIGSKAIASQVVRSSSICSKNFAQTKQEPLTNKISFLVPKTNTSPILAKYFSITTQLKSADGKGHDHVTIWKLERLLSLALLPLIPAALIAPNPALDTIVALSIVMHTHWGLEAIVVDYIRPILFGEIGPKIGMGALYVFSAVTLAGCLNLIYNDIGLANAFLELWKL